jgi:hypothetical protein
MFVTGKTNEVLKQYVVDAVRKSWTILTGYEPVKNIIFVMGKEYQK